MSTIALARPAPVRVRRRPAAPPVVVRPQPRPGVPFMGVDDIPHEFAMQIDGDCLAPDLNHGDVVVFTKDGKPKAGDLAIFILREELVPAGGLQCAIKRLVTSIPSYVSFPWREHPESTVHALAVVAQTNPPAQYGIKCERLLAVLRFSHIQRKAQS